MAAKSKAKGTALRRRLNPRPSASFEFVDSSVRRFDAARLITGAAPRDVTGYVARLATQFIALNRPHFADVGVEVSQEFDGSRVLLVFSASTQIGAVPLISPTSGRPDHALVIKPRFEWDGLGLMLSEMGWRVIPKPLQRAQLPRSERSIPPWVLSTVVLRRVQAMLDALQRRFEVAHAIRTAPRGRVEWPSYARRSIARARFLDVPCQFPDLRDDRDLRAAIHFALRKQRQSLEGQIRGGVVVLRLLELCRALIERVRDVPPTAPSPVQFDAWLRGSLKSLAFEEGVNAVRWTVEDRGLAGPHDLEGLPWVMKMEEFFEAWVETVLAAVARQSGGILRAGRLRQTVTPLQWQPPFIGSQKSLVPDLVLERGDTAVIVDAKYKPHWEEIDFEHWWQTEAELREQHRADLLQALAYANVVNAPRTIVSLVYPCSNRTWDSLRERGRLVYRAALRAGEREVDLVLTAFPMGKPVSEVARQAIAALN